MCFSRQRHKRVSICRSKVFNFDKQMTVFRLKMKFSSCHWISTLFIISILVLGCFTKSNEVFFGGKTADYVKLLVNTARTFKLLAKDGLLFTARGDGAINAYNITTFEIVRTFEGLLLC
jgi:hypothetical protein